MTNREYTEDELALIKKTIKELVIACLALAIPYVLIGLVWAGQHSNHLAVLNGPDRLFSYIGEVVAWPVLTISDITLK